MFVSSVVIRSVGVGIQQAPQYVRSSRCFLDNTFHDLTSAFYAGSRRLRYASTGEESPTRLGGRQYFPINAESNSVTIPEDNLRLSTKVIGTKLKQVKERLLEVNKRLEELKSTPVEEVRSLGQEEILNELSQIEVFLSGREATLDSTREMISRLRDRIQNGSEKHNNRNKEIGDSLSLWIQEPYQLIFDIENSFDRVIFPSDIKINTVFEKGFYSLSQTDLVILIFFQHHLQAAQKKGLNFSEIVLGWGKRVQEISQRRPKLEENRNNNPLWTIAEEIHSVLHEIEQINNCINGCLSSVGKHIQSLEKEVAFQEKCIPLVYTAIREMPSSLEGLRSSSEPFDDLNSQFPLIGAAQKLNQWMNTIKFLESHEWLFTPDHMRRHVELNPKIAQIRSSLLDYCSNPTVATYYIKQCKPYLEGLQRQAALVVGIEL